MRRNPVAILAIALFLLAAACGGDNTGTGDGSPESGAYVTGTVTYRERIAMPPNATIEVALNDISVQDPASVVLGTQTIKDPGSSPVAFRVGYDPTAVKQANTYAIQARIMAGKKLWMINRDVAQVITQGHPTSGVRVVVATPSIGGL